MPLRFPVLPLTPRAILLATLLVLAGTGFAAADHPDPDCKSPHKEESAAHPLKPNDYYLYVPENTQDKDEMAKFGWWKNTNGKSGLQTTGCALSTGEVMYEADIHEARLLV